MNIDVSITVTDMVQMLVAIVNVYFVWLVYKLTRKDISPKLFIKPIQRKQKNNLDTEDENYENLFGARVNEEILKIDFEQRGFPDESVAHSPISWEIEIHNSSEYIATNIVLDYEFTIKKVEMEFGIDEADVVSEKFVPFKTIKQTYNLEYLAPNDNKVVRVLILSGKFTKADLKVNKLRCDEGMFINKSMIIDKYEHPDFRNISDSSDHRSLIGAHKDSKK